MMRSIKIFTILFWIAAVLVPGIAEPLQEKPETWLPNTEVYTYRAPGKTGEVPVADGINTIIGRTARHTVQEGETLLDIARRYHLGYQELVQANPDVDPWVPAVGQKIEIPSSWILPKKSDRGFVLNIPEMRLYYFLGDSQVMTFALGVGMEGWDTPAGKFWIGEKRKDPVWYVPAAIQKEMDVPRKAIPPGPENPLGSYWMRLSTTTYGIHGTNNPWAVGRHVTHGCIRLYPEDIAYLYPRVPPKMPVEVIYQHAKVGLRDGVAYFQVYRRQATQDSDLLLELMKQVRDLELEVDLRAMRDLLRTASNGALVPVPLKSIDD